MDVMDLIQRRLEVPKNFRVTTTYECGKKRTHDVETMGQAKNWVDGENHKLGKDLIDRESGKTVRVVDVSISRI